MRYRGLIITLLLFAITVFLFAFFQIQSKPTDTGNEQENTTLLPLISTPTATIADPIRGNENAPITIIEYGDYFCAYCKDIEAVIEEVLVANPNTVRFVWKDYPNPAADSQSFEAAKAARCAGEQNAFWQFHSALMEQTSLFSFTSYETIAMNLGLDPALLTTCMSSERATALVTRTLQEAQALQLPGVPFFFIQGQPFNGTTVAEFQNAIAREIK